VKKILLSLMAALVIGAAAFSVVEAQTPTYGSTAGQYALRNIFSGATDEYALTWEASTGLFEWQPAFSGTLSSGQFLGPNGTASAPTYAFTNGLTSGMYYSTNQLLFSAAGTATFGVSSSGVKLNKDFPLAWTAGDAANATLDTLIYREAAATFQFGADVNGAAVAQTLKCHDGITGTDVAGANCIFAGGRGTGAGPPGNLIFQTATALGSGTTGQTLATRLTISPSLATFATTVYGSGTQIMYGFIKAQSYITTTGVALNAGHVGQLISNDGDTDGAGVTLISASGGICQTFVLTAAQTFTITANTGDTIRIDSTVTAAGGSIDSNEIGESITLCAINATEWIATSHVHDGTPGF
jgi:hypothetical protein